MAEERLKNVRAVADGTDAKTQETGKMPGTLGNAPAQETGKLPETLGDCPEQEAGKAPEDRPDRTAPDSAKPVVSETWAEETIADLDDFIESQGIYIRQ